MTSASSIRSPNQEVQADNDGDFLIQQALGNSIVSAFGRIRKIAKLKNWLKKGNSSFSKNEIVTESCRNNKYFEMSYPKNFEEAQSSDTRMSWKSIEGRCPSPAIKPG